MDSLVKDVSQIDRKLLENTTAIERRLSGDVDKKFDLIHIDMEKRLGLVETDYRSAASAMKAWTDNQESRMGLLETEVKGVRERVEKKR
jgi:hypothetical protein